MRWTAWCGVHTYIQVVGSSAVTSLASWTEIFQILVGANPVLKQTICHPITALGSTLYPPECLNKNFMY